MDLLERILNCNSDEEANLIIAEEIEKANDNSSKIDILGFLDYGKSNNIFKGFIPLDTRIKYASINMETYSMSTTDFFYEFAHFIRKYKINNKGALIHLLEFFINNYFGYPGKQKRETIFNDIAWQTTTTDEEYFAALENNKIGDLKGKGAAECTERSALAQQILSLFGTETYYCIGCVDLGDKQEGHCFNIVKRKNDYALLDYSIPVTAYNQDGSIKAFYPFIGEIANDEFEQFITNGTLKTFKNYEIINGNQKSPLNSQRTYVVGSFEIQKQQTDTSSVKK